MRLEWSPSAVEDRERIFAFIEQSDPQAAVAVDHRIGTLVTRLAGYPESGRPGRIAGTRELIIGCTPYIVAYRIVGDTVRILRVLHEAQQWAPRRPGLVLRHPVSGKKDHKRRLESPL